MTATNRSLAEQLRERARAQAGGTTHRAALLTLAVCFAETRTPEAAHRLLNNERIPTHVRERAHELLRELEHHQEVTP